MNSIDSCFIDWLSVLIFIFHVLSVITLGSHWPHLGFVELKLFLMVPGSPVCINHLWDLSLLSFYFKCSLTALIIKVCFLFTDIIWQQSPFIIKALPIQVFGKLLLLSVILECKHLFFFEFVHLTYKFLLVLKIINSFQSHFFFFIEFEDTSSHLDLLIMLILIHKLSFHHFSWYCSPWTKRLDIT